MAKPLTIVFADDQLPWDQDADNQRVREEIRREFAVAKPGVDVDSAFAEDQAWFSGLLAYLEQTKGETVIRVRHFDEARTRLAQAQEPAWHHPCALAHRAEGGEVGVAAAFAGGCARRGCARRRSRSKAAAWVTLGQQDWALC